MKSYEEMTACVLAARDTYVRKQRKRRAVMLHCVPAVCCAALIALVRQVNRLPQTVPQSDTPAYQCVTDAPDTPVQTMPAVLTAAVQTEAEKPAELTPAAEQTAEAQPEPEQREDNSVSEQVVVPTDDVPQTEPPAETAAPQQTAQTTAADGDQSACPDPHTYRPWDELPVNQQYFGADIGKIPAVNPTDTVYYQTAAQEVPAETVGDYLCEAFMSGYDFYDPAADRYYHCYAKAFRIKGREQNDAVAIQFEEGGAYYLYVHQAQNTNETAPDGLTG